MTYSLRYFQVWKATGFNINLSSRTLIQIHFNRWEELERKNEKSEESNASNQDTKEQSVSQDGNMKEDAKVEPHMEPNQAMMSTELEDKLAKATLEADRFSTHYIGSALIPLVLSFIIRSLIYDRHKSWYSWFIGSLTSCVYTFGFVFMCPQLYINHKLKSVSHLPWNVSSLP